MFYYIFINYDWYTESDVTNMCFLSLNNAVWTWCGLYSGATSAYSGIIFPLTQVHHFHSSVRTWTFSAAAALSLYEHKCLKSWMSVSLVFLPKHLVSPAAYTDAARGLLVTSASSPKYWPRVQRATSTSWFDLWPALVYRETSEWARVELRTSVRVREVLTLLLIMIRTSPDSTM